jgi:hypothetical protein
LTLFFAEFNPQIQETKSELMSPRRRRQRAEPKRTARGQKIFSPETHPFFAHSPEK